MSATGTDDRASVLFLAGGVVAAVGMAALLALAVSRPLMRFFEHRARTAASPAASALAESAPAQAPEPRLQARPGEDLQALRAYEDGLLEGYAWVDRAGGLVRIPITRAMELVVQGRYAEPGGSAR